MIVTQARARRSKAPIALPEPWLAAWRAPDSEPVTSFALACYELHTDEGIVGIGPYTGADPALAEGIDPGLGIALDETLLD